MGSSENQAVAKKQKIEEMTLPQLLKQNSVRQTFTEMLGNLSAPFINDILTLYRSGGKAMEKCDAISILSAAKKAASFKLPIHAQLGQAYIIPYYDSKAKKRLAQFMIGYKGLIQLAMRSGQYLQLNAVEIYDGEIKQFNRITGEVEFSERKSEKVVGYVAYMKLINGFTKTVYMSRDEMVKHAKKYSDSYKKNMGVWATNFDAMARKTVLKKLLSTYAPLSIEMQDMTRAMQADQAVINSDGTLNYVDNQEPPIDIEPESESETILQEVNLETGEINKETEKKSDDEVPLPFD